MTRHHICSALFVGFLVFAAFDRNASGSTEVSGFISSDTTWNAGGSPYVATGSVIVRSGVTLTIEPGVQVRFQGGRALLVEGALVARGTAERNIIFTSDSPGERWGYIRFNDTSVSATYDDLGSYTGGSILEYCIVELAGANASSRSPGAITLLRASPFVSHTIVRNNRAMGIYASATVVPYNRTLRLTDNTVANNSQSGYSAGSNDAAGISIQQYGGSVLLTNNTIRANSADFGGAAGGVSLQADATVTHNIVDQNTSKFVGGMRVTGAGAITTISGNVVTRNAASSTFYAATGGIQVKGSTGEVQVSNNIVADNVAMNADDCRAGDFRDLTLNPCNAGGIFVAPELIDNFPGGAGPEDRVVSIAENALLRNVGRRVSAIADCGGSKFVGTNSRIEQNTLAGNLASAASLPTEAVSWCTRSEPVLRLNNIFGNLAAYDLLNTGSVGRVAITVPDNWWGSSSESTIQARIFDFVDNPLRSVVDYVPFEAAIRTDTPVSPVADVAATTGAGLMISWSANPESDIAGYRVHWSSARGSPYANVIDVGSVTSYTIEDPPAGTVYVAVTAYDADYDLAGDDPETVVNDNQTSGHESWYSEEVVVIPPTATRTFTLTRTPTRTVTATPNPTRTPTRTSTKTPTNSPTEAATRRPTVTQTATPTTLALCAGDCDRGGGVTIEELLTMVNIALGGAPISACPPGDGNGDGEITIAEILAAVNSALAGCPVALM